MNYNRGIIIWWIVVVFFGINIILTNPIGIVYYVAGILIGGLTFDSFNKGDKS